MKEIYSQFCIDGYPIQCSPFGSGHINETYLLVTNRPALYILQKLNAHIFKDIPALMENIQRVSEHLQKKSTDPHSTLRLIPLISGGFLLNPSDGQYWRMFEYVYNGITLDQVETIDDLRQSGAAFGAFQNTLSDFPADTLHEIIPRFHDTPDRFRQFHDAVRKDASHRLAAAKDEVDGFMQFEEIASLLISQRDNGKLPIRVTHNDTKLNNVLLDASTHKPLCIIDLDTVMPGLAAYDFGDAIRFGASTALEDERDLTKVAFSLDLFKAYAQGFLAECGKSLTSDEIRSLAPGALLMTVECGIRFLGDFINGDIYFHTAYPEHNLIRARTQLKLACQMREQMDTMQDFISSCI